MNKIFQIIKYEPNKELVLQPQESSNTIIYFVIVLLIFFAISFTVIAASFFPIIIFGMIGIISWFSLKNQMAKLITFTPNELIIDYKIGFISWKGRYNNMLEMDWFINVNEKPVKIKIGYQDKLILRFTLENLGTLPVLTKNVSEIMSMEVDMNETIGKWENIRLRSLKQLPNRTEFHNIIIQNDGLSMKVFTYGVKRFEIDLQKGALIHLKWLVTNRVDLQHVNTIYYYFDYTNVNALTRWAYVDKRTNETVEFFKFRPQSSQYEEMHYAKLNFKIDNRNLVRLLQSLPVFNGIEIKEQEF